MHAHHSEDFACARFGLTVEVGDTQGCSFAGLRSPRDVPSVCVTRVAGNEKTIGIGRNENRGRV